MLSCPPTADFNKKQACRVRGCCQIWWFFVCVSFPACQRLFRESHAIRWQEASLMQNCIFSSKNICLKELISHSMTDWLSGELFYLTLISNIEKVISVQNLYPMPLSCRLRFCSIWKLRGSKKAKGIWVSDRNVELSLKRLNQKIINRHWPLTLK